MEWVDPDNTLKILILIFCLMPIFVSIQMQDRANEGSEVSGPHMTLKYRDRSILDDAVTLIVHHMKRQTSLHKEDKQSIKELLYHFMPDMFHMPRGELSDDEQDKDDDSQYRSLSRRSSSFLGALKSLKKKKIRDNFGSHSEKKEF